MPFAPSPRKITMLMGGIPTINLMGGLWHCWIPTLWKIMEKLREHEKRWKLLVTTCISMLHDTQTGWLGKRRNIPCHHADCAVPWRRRLLNARLRGLYLSASEKPVVSDAFLRDVIQRTTEHESCEKLDHWMTLDDLRWYPLVIYHNYWKWPFIVGFPIENCDFP